MLVARGAHLIQADHIAHELMQPGTAVYDEVVHHFGRGILESDGRINRQRLAEAVFGQRATGSSRSLAEPQRVQELNKIVHPAVIRRQEEWMDEVGRGDAHAITVVDAALIVEAGAAKRFDKLIVVTCHTEQRVQRLAQRLHITAEAARREVERRLAAQMPDEEKARLADYVIDNSGSLAETERQVEKIFGDLKKEALRP
jgi:dephospho-CoA kinase